MLFRQSRFSLIRVLSAGLFLVIPLSLTTGGFAAESRFSIRISGGLGYLSLAEMNNGIRGVMNDIWYSFQQKVGTGSTYNDLKMGTDVGVDVFYYVTPKIGIGLGVEYIRGRKKSTYTFSGQFSGSVSAEPLLTALPIKAGLFLKLPLSGKLHLTADLGAGYYRASLDNTYTWEITGVAPQTIERFKVSSWRPGFHGGVGLEYSIGSRVALFFEALGRLVKIKGLKGTVQYNQNASEPATLYFYESLIEDRAFPILDASTTEPSGPDVRNVWEAVINLSGGTALLGLVIRF